MYIIIIGIIILGIITFIIGYFQYKKEKKLVERGEIENISQVNEVDQECCGAHEVCEKDSLLSAVSKQIEYYDDEELDSYRHTAANEYSEEALEEFRNVFYTLKEVEVAGWVRSLQLREIELPDELKDEVLLIISERRIAPLKKGEHDA
ncbi:MAG: phospholipase [Bacteroidales bacterium]|nr:phospholipase [Bacteroidales bacterium]